MELLFNLIDIFYRKLASFSFSKWGFFVNYLILAFAKGEVSSFFLSLDSFSSLLCRLLTTESDALSTGVLVRSTQEQVIFS